MYAEMSYFDGYAFQHIAAYHEHLRLKWLRRHTDAAIRNLYNRRFAA